MQNAESYQVHLWLAHLQLHHAEKQTMTFRNSRTSHTNFPPHFSVPVQGARHVLQLRRDGALHPGAGRGRAAAQGAGGESGLRPHPGGGRRGAAQDHAHLHPTVRAPRPIHFSKSAKISVFNVLSCQLLPKFIHWQTEFNKNSIIIIKGPQSGRRQLTRILETLFSDS